MKHGLFYLNEVVNNISRGYSYVLHSGKYRMIDCAIEQKQNMKNNKQFEQRGIAKPCKGEIHSNAKMMVKAKIRK